MKNKRKLITNVTFVNHACKSQKTVHASRLFREIKSLLLTCFIQEGRKFWYWFRTQTSERKYIETKLSPVRSRILPLLVNYGGILEGALSVITQTMGLTWWQLSGEELQPCLTTWWIIHTNLPWFYLFTLWGTKGNPITFKR
jgi:hypothetical protein